MADPVQGLNRLALVLALGQATADGLEWSLPAIKPEDWCCCRGKELPDEGTAPIGDQQGRG